MQYCVSVKDILKKYLIKFQKALKFMKYLRVWIDGQIGPSSVVNEASRGLVDDSLANQFHLKYKFVKPNLSLMIFW